MAQRRSKTKIYLLSQMKFYQLILGVFSLATSLSLQAGVIQTERDFGGYQLDYHEPIGQSFIAEDSAIKFAFAYFALNPHSLNDPIKISLVAGAGVTGPMLSTVEFSLASDFDGFFDIDFSTVGLTIGETYTAVLTTPGSSPFWGIDAARTNYLGGTGFLVGNKINFDWAFRVTPVSQSIDVPEPGTLAIFALGLLGLGCVSRRKLQPQ